MVTRIFAQALLLATLSVAGVTLTACNNNGDSISGRNTEPTPGGGGGGGEKPAPSIVEKMRPLLLQKPTLTEERFLNTMQLEFGEAEQAAFTFTFTAPRSGSLFFTNIQSRLHLEGCTKDTKRAVKFNVVWQEDLGTRRTRLKTFSPDITEYSYEAGKKYMLTYALIDLKGELSDCKSATVKFAAFDKNYSKSEE